MNSKIVHLAERRAILVARIARQRMQLAEAVAPFRGPLAVVDKGLHALRYLANHPLLVAGVVTIAGMIKSRHWLSVLKKGWMLGGLALAARRRIG